MFLYKQCIKCLIMIFFFFWIVPGAFAQEPGELDKDTFFVNIKDEKDVSVGLSLPLSLNNAQCKRRIYGTRTGFAGMFKTLSSEQRRIESYEAGIRELSMQPEGANNYIDELELVLEKAGVASDDIGFVLGLINKGSQSINKKYVKGGNLAANAHNRLAKGVGRKLNAIKKNPAFKAACLAMEEIKAMKQLTDSVVGAFLLNSLSTDQAWKRLQKIESAMYIARQTGRMVDPALYKALEEAKINLLAARNNIGSFAVYVNDHLQEITDSGISLGSALGQMSAKFSAPVAMWVGAPLMTYNTLRGISNQWELAQDAVTLATITRLLKDSAQGKMVQEICLYGEYAFYSKMQEAFSVGGAQLRDFLNPGHKNKDWAGFYQAQKDEVGKLLFEGQKDYSGVYELAKTYGFGADILEVRDYGKKAFVKLSSVSRHGHSCTLQGKAPIQKNKIMVQDKTSSLDNEEITCAASIEFVNNDAQVSFDKFSWECKQVLCGKNAFFNDGKYIRVHNDKVCKIKDRSFFDLLDTKRRKNGEFFSKQGTIVLRLYEAQASVLFKADNKWYVLGLVNGYKPGQSIPDIPPYMNLPVFDFLDPDLKPGETKIKDLTVKGVCYGEDNELVQVSSILREQVNSSF